MNVRPIFRWFDLWVGVFIDRPGRRVYVFPLPCLGIVFERRHHRRRPEGNPYIPEWS